MSMNPHVQQIVATAVAAERERITGLFDEWIAVCLAEPNHHPVEAWKAGFRSLVDPDHPGAIATASCEHRINRVAP